MLVMGMQLGVDPGERPVAGIQGETVAHPSQPSTEAQVRTTRRENRDNLGIREELPDGILDGPVEPGVGRGDFRGLRDQTFNLHLPGEVTEGVTQLGVDVVIGLAWQRADVELQVGAGRQDVDRLPGAQHGRRDGQV